MRYPKTQPRRPTDAEVPAAARRAFERNYRRATWSCDVLEVLGFVAFVIAGIVALWFVGQP